MNIHIRTLAIIISLANFIQVIALFVQYRINKTHRGLGWWTLGIAAIALGFAIDSLWEAPSPGPIRVIAPNILFISGLALLYDGTMRFLDQRERRGPLIALCAVFTLLIIYFSLVDSNGVVRRVIFSIAVAAISLLTTQGLLTHKIRPIAASVNFLAMVFLTNGVFFIARALIPATDFLVRGDFISSSIQAASYLVAFSATMLWTFGFVFMINQHLNAELDLQANTDELTGVFNRRHFLDLAHRELQRANRYKRPLAIVFFDIDHFKQINDTYGHAVGDQALLAFTKICKKNIRGIDLFARFGGDEFVLLMPETNCEQAHEVAKRICLTLASQSIDIGGNLFSIMASSGISTLSTEYESLDMLLGQADKALYQAKETGRL
jgi:diguanylate cyclase (GGDEF)-like protein